MKKFCSIKNIYVLLIILFAIPSLYHIISSGFLLKGGEYFTFFLRRPIYYNLEPKISAIIYAAFFIAMFAIYFIFLKKRQELFKTQKSMFVFIILVSILFALILPITSSDVFSYATTGEIQSTYGANPYYDKIVDIKQNNDISNNQILNAIHSWDNQLVIYGPLWSLICALITFLSFSNISIVIILFKTLGIVVHVLNCVLIYKIVKKKFWVVFYGLNPYILFETLSNVHNDIYLVFFTLLGLYFFIKRKNLIGALFFFACATCIKYLTVLLVPLILIYYYRNESIGKRIIKCIKSGLIYTLFVVGMYLLYLRNFEMIFYVLIQQGKFRESIGALLYIIFQNLDYFKYHSYVMKGITVVCIALYVGIIINLLRQKEIRLKDIMNKYNCILLIFILVFITNLCSWYFVWLFPVVMWQKSRNIKITMYLPLIYELLISYYFVLKSDIATKSYWFSTAAILSLIFFDFIGKKMKFGNGIFFRKKLLKKHV